MTVPVTEFMTLKAAFLIKMRQQDTQRQREQTAVGFHRTISLLFPLFLLEPKDLMTCDKYITKICIRLVKCYLF